MAIPTETGNETMNQDGKAIPLIGNHRTPLKQPFYHERVPEIENCNWIPERKNDPVPEEEPSEKISCSDTKNK